MRFLLSDTYGVNKKGKTNSTRDLTLKKALIFKQWKENENSTVQGEIERKDGEKERGRRHTWSNSPKKNKYRGTNFSSYRGWKAVCQAREVTKERKIRWYLGYHKPLIKLRSIKLYVWPNKLGVWVLPNKR